jgi:hypothetical protein
MHAADFLLTANPPDAGLPAAGAPERTLVLEGLLSKGVRLAAPCPPPTRRWKLNEEPTRHRQTSRRRTGSVRWEPDAGSFAIGKVFFPKEILLASSNLSRNNRLAGAPRPPEGV